MGQQERLLLALPEQQALDPVEGPLTALELHWIDAEAQALLDMRLWLERAEAELGAWGPERGR